LPEDWEEKDYFAEYEIRGGARGQVKYHLAGINLTVLASLDKPFYSEGGSAHLSLSVSTLNSISHSLFARVNYSGYEAKQPFMLNGNQSLSFDIPLAKITGEKLFFGIYQESGRSIHLNSLYLYQAGEILTLETDKQVYQPGEAVTVRMSSPQGVSGNLTLSAPGYEKNIVFSGSTQEIFVLPAVMTAGTYYIGYQISAVDGQQYSGSHPFDVQGIQVKVKEARLDKGRYAPEDAIILTLAIESNQDLGATLKTWIVDPEKNYDSAGTLAIPLSSAQPFLAVHSAPLSTTKLGIHRMVYGIYKEEMLLCSGSYAFDVGEAILLGISTDKADYPQGNEPVTIEAQVHGTVPGNLEFSVDGQPVGSHPVSLSGFSSIQYTLPAAAPGLRTLKVSLISGGLTSTKQIDFIYGSNLPDLSVRMASDPNIEDGILTILITVTNRGKSASGPTTLSLYDGGDPLANFDVKSLQPGESQSFTFSLNVSGRAGATSLQGRIDPGNQVDEYSKGNNEARFTFTVPDLALKTILEKGVYSPGETVGITSAITNLSLDSLSGLTLTTEVKDAAGLPVFHHTQTLPLIKEGTTFSFQAFWLTEASLKEGVYSIRQTIEGEVTARAAASVEIKDFAKGLEGAIAAQPNPVNQGGQETLSYTLMNKGSIDLSGLMVKVLVVNPDTGEIRNNYERFADLPRNDTLSGSFSFATADLAPRVYTASLQVSSAAFSMTKILGSVSFEVKPVLPMITWGKNFGGGGNGVAYAIRQTLDGGYLAAGATSSFFQLVRDAWVGKLGPQGEIQWQKAYGTAAGDAVYAVYPTTDGGYVIAGETYGILGIGRQIWVGKLYVDGEIQWQKTYGNGWARSVRQTHEGGYIVAGEREDHAWVMKLDGKGNILWQKGYGSHGDAVYSVQETADGGYVLAGITGSEESKAAWAAKLDAEGEVQWQKVYGTGHGEAAYSIQQLCDGGYIMAGITNTSADGNYDAWVLRLDPYGAIRWQKAYGGLKVDVAYSIGQTTDDGFVLAGITNSFGNGDYDAWVLRLDPHGEIHWQKAYGAQHGDAAFGVEQAQDGGFIVAGGTNSFADRDYDVWVWKVDEGGNLSDCQEGWMKSTDGLARETQAIAQDGPMVAQDIFGLAKEGKAWAKEMQGSVIDLCAGIPDISVDPSSRFLPFSRVKVGKSSTKSITVSNLGTGDLGIESIQVNGASFSQKNDCTALSPGDSCAIAVTFKPTAPGVRAGFLEIYSNDPDENVVRFGLSGTGY
jgi:hypothetical protein